MDVPAVLLPANCVSEEYLYVKSYPCPCRAVGYEVFEQQLIPAEQAPDGKPMDVLKARCGGCGTTHEFRFDITNAFLKMCPDVPSQLFDVVEWFTYLTQLLHNVPESVGPIELPVGLEAMMAVEQVLLFFDPGEETPRADAFFHTPNPPEEIRPYLTRPCLEAARQHLRDRMGQLPEI